MRLKSTSRWCNEAPAPVVLQLLVQHWLSNVISMQPGSKHTADVGNVDCLQAQGVCLRIKCNRKHHAATASAPAYSNITPAAMIHVFVLLTARHNRLHSSVDTTTKGLLTQTSPCPQTQLSLSSQSARGGAAPAAASPRDPAQTPAQSRRPAAASAGWQTPGLKRCAHAPPTRPHARGVPPHSPRRSPPPHTPRCR
ncbi:hypothetical protein COO60DRAFT_1481373 [Scenedesmus sp. NREL 46B-D3]|nr:hypothetical protein COO60DRAFT_1481373 [Scenedesmus sp. NREL 46B-D3]